MTSPADIAADQDEGLRQLFQAGLELALQVQANAMAAEPADQARLSLTFHRLSRGVRQTAALRMKLAREAERSGREIAADVIQLDQRRLEKRKAHVKAAVECLIWTEAEDDDSLEALKEDLADLLDIETQDAPTFEAEPLDAQIERLARVIGVPSPLAGEGVGQSPTDEGSPGDRRSDPPLRGRWPEGPEGVEAHSPLDPASQPPQSRRDSSPSGGASKDDDPLLSDDYWRSSA
jgi:hypothetical protein